MGIFVLLTGVVLEIAFATFCIITKSNQQEVRSIIRITAFTAFVLFTVVGIIDWSFRYYSVGALLFLLAIIGAVAPIRKRQEKRAYRAVSVILKGIGMTLLIFASILPAIVFPQYETIAVTGEYQVTTATYTYTDTRRVETYTDTGENRKLNVKLWYPKHVDGTYPLIVFSHGSLGIKSSNESLYNELASHGYVVCAVDHRYQCLYTTDEDGQITFLDLGYMQELINEDADSDRQQSHEYYQKWMKIRTSDIEFVIDYILAKAGDSDVDTVYELVDTTRIGVMGHSLGGSAALGIGRMREDVNAVVALESPFMCDIEGVEDGEFVFREEIYPVPVLNVYSDSSWSFLDKWPQYVENYALLSDSNATAFNVHISGVWHLTLTDLALTSPILTRILNEHESTTSAEYCLKVINKVCLEYFDCYLKGKGEFTSDGTY